MIRPIVIAPHSALKKIAQPVNHITDQVRTVLDDMIETMYGDKGCGLAANQINLLYRLIVMDCTKDKTEPMKLINPEIVWHSEEKCTNKEGCLSFPDIYVDVERSQKVHIRYLNENGIAQERQLEGYWAICVQHEIDHLNGITFIHHLPKIKQRQILEKLSRRSVKPN